MVDSVSAGGRNRLPDSIRVLARQLIKDGYSAREVSKKIGVSETAIRKWVDIARTAPNAEALAENIKMLHAWPSNRSESAE